MDTNYKLLALALVLIAVVIFSGCTRTGYQTLPANQQEVDSEDDCPDGSIAEPVDDGPPVCPIGEENATFDSLW